MHKRTHLLSQFSSKNLVLVNEKTVILRLSQPPFYKFKWVACKEIEFKCHEKRIAALTRLIN